MSTTLLEVLPIGSTVFCSGPDYRDDAIGTVARDEAGLPCVILAHTGDIGRPMSDELVPELILWEGTHTEDCPVTVARDGLLRDLQAEPTNPYLIGAVPEYGETGDQTVELCLCGAVPGFQAVTEDELVPAHVCIPVPWGLSLDELRLDPAAEDSHGAGSLLWLLQQPNEQDPDELRRVLYGAVSLSEHLDRIGEPASFGACLSTAIIWERG